MTKMIVQKFMAMQKQWPVPIGLFASMGICMPSQALAQSMARSGILEPKASELILGNKLSFKSGDE